MNSTTSLRPSDIVPIKRRTRAEYACLGCNHAHMKCDKEVDQYGQPWPCTRCTKKGLRCQYPRRVRGHLLFPNSTGPLPTDDLSMDRQDGSAPTEYGGSTLDPILPQEYPVCASDIERFRLHCLEDVVQKYPNSFGCTGNHTTGERDLVQIPHQQAVTHQDLEFLFIPSVDRSGNIVQSQVDRSNDLHAVMAAAINNVCVCTESHLCPFHIIQTGMFFADAIFDQQWGLVLISLGISSSRT